MTDKHSQTYHKTEVSNTGKLFTRLQRGLKVTTIFMNTRTQSNTPLWNSPLSDSVVEAMPLMDKMLLNVVDIVYPGMVDLSTQHVPDFVVNRIKVWDAGWP